MSRLRDLAGKLLRRLSRETPEGPLLCWTQTGSLPGRMVTTRATWVKGGEKQQELEHGIERPIMAAVVRSSITSSRTSETAVAVFCEGEGVKHMAPALARTATRGTTRVGPGQAAGH